LLSKPIFAECTPLLASQANTPNRGTVLQYK
jgi:hypothetical protein